MAQWIKNLNTVAWVDTEVWVRSLARCSGLKDPALLKLQHRSQLAQIQPLAQELLYICQKKCSQKKKGRKKKKKKESMVD